MHSNSSRGSAFSRRSAWSVAAAGILFLALPARGQDKPDLSKVTITAAIASNIGPDARMQAAGNLKGVPYDLKFAHFAGGPAVVEAMRSGSADLGYGSDTATIFGLVGGSVDYVIVMAMPMNTPFHLDGAILASKTSNIKTLADLKGKKVSVTPGTGSQYMGADWLKHAGLSFRDVQVANLSPADSLAALNSGQVDAWITYSPFIGTAAVKFGATILTDDIRVPGSVSVIWARRQALQDPAKAAAIGDFLVRVRDAHTWMVNNVGEWAKTMATIGKMDPAIARDSAERTTRGLMPVDDALVARVQAQADTFYELGALSRKVEVTKAAFDDRYNKLLFPK